MSHLYHQATAVAFIANGNMIAISDRGDRLLLLNYHGLHPAKRVTLPWADPQVGSAVRLLVVW